MSGLVNRIRNGIPRPHLHAAGTEEVKGKDMWLDNDDIRYVIQCESIELPLTNLQTTQARRSNMGHEGIPDLLVQRSSHCFELVRSILSPSSGVKHVGVHRHCSWRTDTHRDCHRVQRSCWSKISHWFSRAEQSCFWSLRSMVANIQSCRDGHRVERSQRGELHSGLTTPNLTLISHRCKEVNAST